MDNAEFWIQALRLGDISLALVVMVMFSRATSQMLSIFGEQTKQLVETVEKVMTMVLEKQSLGRQERPYRQDRDSP